MTLFVYLLLYLFTCCSHKSNMLPSALGQWDIGGGFANTDHQIGPLMETIEKKIDIFPPLNK